MSQQLTLSLPTEPALGRGDFFVSPANAAAVEAMQTWHDWPQGKLILAGPPRAGKTHLTHVWAVLTGARIVNAAEIGGAVEALAASAVAVEDVDQIAGDRAAEEAVFHLHNLALANGAPVLFTAQAPPARWGLSLPDLQSRMQGTALVSLSAPDDALLAAVLMKLFADRQVAVEPGVIPYLTARMDRSFAAASAMVDALDRAALAEKRRITRALAALVLDKLAEEAP